MPMASQRILSEDVSTDQGYSCAQRGCKEKVAVYSPRYQSQQSSPGGEYQRNGFLDHYQQNYPYRWQGYPNRPASGYPWANKN